MEFQPHDIPPSMAMPKPTELEQPEKLGQWGPKTVKHGATDVSDQVFERVIQQPREEQAEPAGHVIKEGEPTPSQQKTMHVAQRVEIQKKVLEKELRQMSTQISDVHARTGTSLQFRSFGASANPVTKIQQQAYIQQDVIATELEKPRDSAAMQSAAFDAAVSKFVKEASNPQYKRFFAADNLMEKLDNLDNPAAKKGGLNALKQAKGNYVALLQKIHPNLTKEEIVDRAQKAINSLVKDLEDNPRAKQFVQIAKQFGRDVDTAFHTTSLEHVPTLYSKDECLSRIRTLLAQDTIAPEVKGYLTALLKELKSTQASYVALPDMPESIRKMVGSLTKYVSTQDILMQNKSSPDAATLVQRTSQSRQEFFFKLGAENEREILAGVLLQDLGLSEFVVPKAAVSFPGVSFLGEMAPAGIASLAVEEGKSFEAAFGEDWIDTAKQRLEVEKLKLGLQNALSSNDTERVADLQQQIENETSTLSEYESDLRTFASERKPFEKELKKLKGSSEHDQIAALNDNLQTIATQAQKINRGIRNDIVNQTLLCGNDAHIGQYLVQGDSVYNIDFARFLGPTYFSKSPDAICCTLRCQMLDHPAAAEALSPQEIKQYLTMAQNFVNVEKKWTDEGIIGTHEFFEKAAKEMDDISKQLLQNPPNAQELRQKREEIKKECFRHIHPEAFKELKARMEEFRNYLQECVDGGKEANMQEAALRMYPDLAIFIKVLGRENMFPFGSISQGVINGVFNYRALNNFMEHAKDTNLATADELAQMEQSLQNMSKQVKPTTVAQMAWEFRL